MIELKDCIGKFIYGKDSNDSEIWCFNLLSHIKKSWGGVLTSEQGIFNTGDSWFNINVSCCVGDDYEGTFTVLKVFDDPQSLLDHIMSRFKEEMVLVGYDVDNDNNSSLNMTGTHYDSIKTDQCIGKYVAAKYIYAHWFFNLQKVTKNPMYKNQVDIEGFAILDSTSNDDVCLEGTTFMTEKELRDVTLYDNPKALLKDIEDYIKEEIELTSGFKW